MFIVPLRPKKEALALVFSPPISYPVLDLGFGPPPMEIAEGGEGKPPPEGFKKPASTPEGGEVKPPKRQMKSPYQLEVLEKTYAGLLIDPIWIISWSIFLWFWCRSGWDLGPF